MYLSKDRLQMLDCDDETGFEIVARFTSKHTCGGLAIENDIPRLGKLLD
jgi:hypothetical protein